MSTFDVNAGTQPPVADAPPSPALPVEPAPAAAEPKPEPPPFGWTPSTGPTLHGVPLVTTDNPNGGHGVGILTALDLAATHEQGQRRVVPDSDPIQYEPVQKSGGSAHYVDLLTGKAWSVALNPEDV